jgi:hypothetical protein
MQDRISQVEEASCTARPDHTFRSATSTSAISPARSTCWRFSAEERARRRALAGSLIALETYELAADGRRMPIQSAAMVWDARLEFADGGRFVHFPRMVRMEARDHAPGEPDRIASSRVIRQQG